MNNPETLTEELRAVIADADLAGGDELLGAAADYIDTLTTRLREVEDALRASDAALGEAIGRLTNIDARLHTPRMDGSGVAEARAIAAIPRGVLHAARTRAMNALSTERTP